MAYRISIEIQTATRTIKTSKQRATATGIQEIKDQVRAKVAPGSTVNFSVKEV